MVPSPYRKTTAVHALGLSIGSLMAKKFGIHAAQRLLRHTSPTITSKFYTDRRFRFYRGLVRCWNLG